MIIKNILVTGGAGFLGSHLCERLLDGRNKVICLDNFYTGSLENIKHLLKNNLFEILEHDICLPLDLEVDEIYNFACPASPVHYQQDAIKTLKTNVVGAINMLELAKKSGSKILQASTSEVYGDPKMHPQREDYWGNVNPLGYRSCYDEGKRCAETLFFDYYRSYEILIKVVRIFNTYGPRMHFHDGRVVSNFIVQALQNQPLTIYGKGEQTRSFCYVDDLIKGIVLLMHTAGDILGPVNLGNPHELTIIELAKKVIEITGSKSRMQFAPLPFDDPKKRRPNITYAKELINWMPKTSIDEGLLLTIKYFDDLLGKDRKACNQL